MQTQVTTINDIRIYPNPASDILNIAFEQGAAEDYEYAVYDINGTMSLHGQIHGNNGRVDISSLPSGMHILKISNGQTSKTTTFTK